MAPIETSVRRWILAGGFALAVAAAPLTGAFAVPSLAPSHQADPVGECGPGEEADQFTNICLPHTVPNSPSPLSTNGANPDIATIDNVPCTGKNYGECVGLEQNAPKYEAPKTSVDGQSEGPT